MIPAVDCCLYGPAVVFGRIIVARLCYEQMVVDASGVWLMVVVVSLSLVGCLSIVNPFGSLDGSVSKVHAHQHSIGNVKQCFLLG